MNMRMSIREEARAKEEVWEMMLLGGPGIGIVDAEWMEEDDDERGAGGESSRRRYSPSRTTMGQVDGMGMSFSTGSLIAWEKDGA